MLKWIIRLYLGKLLVLLDGSPLRSTQIRQDLSTYILSYTIAIAIGLFFFFFFLRFQSYVT